jgi:hypothetical protein
MFGQYITQPDLTLSCGYPGFGNQNVLSLAQTKRILLDSPWQSVDRYALENHFLFFQCLVKGRPVFAQAFL